MTSENPNPTPQGGTPPQAPHGDAASRLASPGSTGEAEGVERELWSGRTSWKHYFFRFVIVFLAAVLIIAGVFWYRGQSEWLTLWRSFLVVIIGVGIVKLFVLMGPFLDIFGNRYRLTTQRLFVERGILRQTIDQVELIRVDDVRIEKSLINRMFGLGTVIVLSTDATDNTLRLEGVAGPEGIAESIRTNMKEARKKSLFMESL
ncbi:MAG: PH domain-containing protein [Phycisphaerae bacterium]